ncbi:hypothetical protein [Bradyrhizobium guangdongense]|nr:hypothetical protein [Bradyrhizobium guangdongense]
MITQPAALAMKVPVEGWRKMLELLVQSMIRKSARRFFEKIMPKQQSKAR